MPGLTAIKRTPHALLLPLLLLCQARLYAVIPPLEREVSLIVKNEKVSVVLVKIQEQTGISFSYSSQLLASSETVSLIVKKKSVREVLTLILPNTITYTSKNNYIILKEKTKKNNPKKQEISGYIYDATTETKIPNVTIYDKNTLQSTTSNEYGYYAMSLPPNSASLTINKLDYKDTVITLYNPSTLTNITLKPANDSIKGDSTALQKSLNKISRQTDYIAMKMNAYFTSMNVKDSLTRDMQISFLPYLGSNHKLSGNVYNRISFNVLGGFARGVKDFELGGLFNIDKENVNGLQIAGVFNLVGDSVRAWQIAGLVNCVGKKTTGVQIAGLANVTEGSVTGVQAAGAINTNSGRVDGFEVAGLLNLNKNGIHGAGIAGLMNINPAVKGVVVAGIGSVQDSLKGTAISGLFNMTHTDYEAVEIAGLFNYSGKGETHLQLSALYNRANFVKGSQIGLINFSDSIRGIPIGLFSHVKSGLHQIEVAGDELFCLQLNYRTGVPLFYNIFQVGLQPGTVDPIWSVGYGLGTNFRIIGKLRSDITLMASHLSKGSFYTATSDRIQLYWGLEYKFHPKFSLAAGPAMNWYISDTKNTNYIDYYSTIAPSYSSAKLYNDGIQINYWLGAKISLRFF